MNKEELSEEQIKEAYNEYAKSHERTSWDGWLLVTPMEHSLESFTEICKSNRKTQLVKFFVRDTNRNINNNS
jgi:hypothetical protein